MMLAFGSDHGGYHLKRLLLEHATAAGHECVDMGTDGTESVDYADFAHRVALHVQRGEADRGVLVCGTGLGMSMAANKHRDVRAAVCSECYSARMSRAHNDANVLCLGERVTGPALAIEILDAWLKTGFDGGRHDRRVSKIEPPQR